MYSLGLCRLFLSLADSLCTRQPADSACAGAGLCADDAAVLGREEDDACAPCAARVAAFVGLRVREEEEAVAAAVDGREVDTERSARQRENKSGNW